MPDVSLIGFVAWTALVFVCGYGVRMRGISALMDDARVIWSEIRDFLEEDEEQEQEPEQSDLNQSWSRRD